jgi:hypothetical protein
MKLWYQEPAVIISLVAAIITLVISFGIHVSTDQTGAIVAVVQVIAGIATRSQVVPQTKLPDLPVPPTTGATP